MKVLSIGASRLSDSVVREARELGADMLLVIDEPDEPRIFSFILQGADEEPPPEFTLLKNETPNPARGKQKRLRDRKGRHR